MNITYWVLNYYSSLEIGFHYHFNLLKDGINDLLKECAFSFLLRLLFDDSYPFVPLEKILKGAVHSNAELALIGAEQWEKQVNEIVSKKLIYYK